jgi:hypothetical protein
MTIPTLLFGFLIATLCGALYHLARGGGAGRLLFYLVLGWAGFAAGQLMGEWFGWYFMRAGTLNIAAASLMSFIVIAIGDWLNHLEHTR